MTYPADRDDLPVAHGHHGAVGDGPSVDEHLDRARAWPDHRQVAGPDHLQTRTCRGALDGGRTGQGAEEPVDQFEGPGVGRTGTGDTESADPWPSGILDKAAQTGVEDDQRIGGRGGQERSVSGGEISRGWRLVDGDLYESDAVPGSDQ